MVAVAIAGGSGGMGKTIVEQLLLDGKHQVFILGRNRQKPGVDSSLGAPVFVQCDYEDIDALTRMLEKNAIETVICTVNVGNKGASEAQLNLIAAADRSNVTRRFIPSDFVVVVDESDEALDGPSLSAPAARALKNSLLEYTHVANGFFMDYWGMPHISSHLDPFSWGLDVANRRAIIPGTGDDIFTTTYSVDVARFVVALLELEEWPKSAVVSGSDITFSELVTIAEEVTGDKFDITYHTEDSIKRGEITLLASVSVPGVSEDLARLMMVESEQAILSGIYHLPHDNRLNDLFEDIRPITIRELLGKAWAGK